MTINLGCRRDDIGTPAYFTAEAVARRRAERIAARAEAWAWRTRPGMPSMRDPDNRTPAWMDPNAPVIPSSDWEHQHCTHESFEDEGGR